MRVMTGWVLLISILGMFVGDIWVSGKMLFPGDCGCFWGVSARVLFVGNWRPFVGDSNVVVCGWLRIACE